VEKSLGVRVPSLAFTAKANAQRPTLNAQFRQH
jgi:hypothetical protein